MCVQNRQLFYAYEPNINLCWMAMIMIMILFWLCILEYKDRVVSGLSASVFVCEVCKEGIKAPTIRHFKVIAHDATDVFRSLVHQVTFFPKFLLIQFVQFCLVLIIFWKSYFPVAKYLNKKSVQFCGIVESWFIINFRINTFRPEKFTKSVNFIFVIRNCANFSIPNFWYI